MSSFDILSEKIDRVDVFVDELRAANEPGVAESVNEAMRTGEEALDVVDDAEYELNKAIERAERTLGGDADE